MTNDNWQNLKSVANEIVISHNDSSSSFREIVSINENWAFIGAENDNVYGPESGAVHVFKLVDNKWIKHSKIIPHDGIGGDNFGSMINVAKNSNTVAITAKNVSATNLYTPGAVYLYSLDSDSWEYRTRLRAQGPNHDIGFGESLSITDTDLIIGAPYDDGAIAGSGSAYFYHRVNSTNWSFTQKIDANETNSNAEFGISVSVDGNRAIVGAQFGLNGVGSATGYVVSYLKTAGVWAQEEKIFGTFSGDLFGRSVSISGNHFIVSEQGASQVHIYDRFIGSWRKLSTFAIPAATELAVKIHGNRAIIGSRTSNNAGFTNNGSIQVYDFDGLATWGLSDTLTTLDRQNNGFVGGRVDFINDKIIASSGINAGYIFNHNFGWSQTPKITPDDSNLNDNFGYSVSVSGDYAVVGAYGNDDFGSESGAVYVFRFINSHWVNTGKLVPTDGQAGDKFGYSVSIDRNFAIVGAYQDDDMGNNAGAAYIFYKELNGNWLQATKLYANDAMPNDNFGRSVSLDGFNLKALVGAEFADIGSNNSVGAAYVFDYNSVTSWPQVEKLTASDASAFYGFGNAVSINSNRILVGSSSDDSNGFGAGSAYVFDYVNNSWNETIKILPNDIIANDNFGVSVSLDGDQLIIGSDNNNGNGTAYIYQRDSNGWDLHTKLIPQFSNANDNFGASVSIKGAFAFVGAYLRDFNGASSGSVYQFTKSNDLWWQTDEFISIQTDGSDNFGRSVSVSRDYVLTGANNKEAGEAYVFNTSQPPSAVSYNLNTNEDTSITNYNVVDDASDPDGGDNRIISVTQPQNGTVSVTNTEISYTPDLNYCNDSASTDDFTYTLNGGSVGSISVTVNCVDDAAVAFDDTMIIIEDESFFNNAKVHINDTDVDGGSIVVSVTQPNHGESMVFNDDAVYRPHPDYCNDGVTQDSFIYHLNGGTSATVFVTVNCVGGDPIAKSDLITVDEDSIAAVLTLLSNDTDDGAQLRITSVTQPLHGSVALDDVSLLPSTVEYTPNPDYCNEGTTTDDFTYTMNYQYTATVFVTVNCIDDEPVAMADSFIINEDTASDLNVYANDTDIDGGPMQADSFTQPLHGIVTEISNGFNYIPNEDYCNTSQATDDFTYQYENATSVTVSIRVNCVYDAAVANNDIYITNEDESMVINPLANDEANDSGVLNLIIDSQPKEGEVTINAGIVTYAPNENYCNDGISTDNFQYSTNDGAMATVSLSVTCVDDLPIAQSDSFVIDEDTISTFDESTLLSNDDFDGGNNDIISITQPSHGLAHLNSNQIDYFPEDNYCTTNGGNADTFTYTVNGGTSATISVTINCIDDLPHGVEDFFTIQEDTQSILDVLLNDTDIDGGPIEIISINDQPAHGTIINNGNNLSYQPEFNYCHNDPNGKETFFYTNNGGGLTLVSIHIQCVDDPLQAIDDFATLNEDESMHLNLIANDVDPDTNGGEIETIDSFTQPANGTVVFSNQGSNDFILYTPNPNYCNDGITLDTFTYTLTNQLTASVYFTVNCVNDRPSFENLGNQVVQEANSYEINNWAFNIDFGADDENSSQSVLNFTVQIVSDTQSILDNVSVNLNGDLSYQTNTNFGMAIVEISMQDDGGTANSGEDTSVVYSLTITQLDAIFINGFEDPNGFRLLDLLDDIEEQANGYFAPYYEFESNIIRYFNYEFKLTDDFESQTIMNQFKTWYDEINKHERVITP